ncbi:MAG: type I-U CRISPR-associated helicase/endonuclease Cas3 [Methylomonas sp.]|nr:type I-U CRISPR-associated helicase/endonuclease Cas3 [Methylomonas sp.]PPD19726.1 MAG: type I-U CRISPR-associated helicase/endonuclease Cas3 [Methylomonas sp.]PPD25036.1 MAG: type I-U CRISPR-associated helicase/endonuclease Cas3 [Methylomonas sp.]PPD39814.1 MAG: type I-U CRISPR-associated helicase/endonuclease Cas3 [Methylomonas sp.]PPD51366.1 MAG: type I-U CRISPR-associated helicase/endonuclease Cas3 [Methylomonas sp.]
MDEQFKQHFLTLSGFPPLLWQQRLFQRFTENRLPDSLDLPTGLGKTSVMLLWLLARTINPKLPKRLIYVVDRRVVVDQATQVAEQIRNGLEQLPPLKAMLGLGEKESLAVSTLRGQFVDNRLWLADPTKPAIVIGTIDMIGSRLLFEGYGVSRNMRRYHAGFLGADSLCVLDEAHLCLPFEAMLQAVTAHMSLHPVEANRPLVPPFKHLSLSATGKQTNKQAFGLEDEDYQDDVVVKRLNAEKQLTLETRNEGDSISELLSENAWQLKASGQRILIFCNKREDAKKIKADLDKRIRQDKVDYPVNLLTGGRRIQERQALVDWLKINGFLAGSSAIPETPAFLIATSAGEVGIDLDADHMVCDLVAYERMVQRFGRVNRRGGKQAQINVIAIPPKSPSSKQPAALDLAEPEAPVEPPENADKAALKQYKQEQKTFDKAQKDYLKAQEEHAQALATYQQSAKEFLAYQAQLEVVKQLEGNASPSALVALKQKIPAQQLSTATSEEPLRPALTRALVDAWSMTSLEQHTARPEIKPWLRGWLPNKESETTLVWREYLPWRDGDDSPNATEVEAFFDNAPIHLSETLDVPVYQAIDTLMKRIKAAVKEQPDYSEMPVLLVFDQSGKLRKDGALNARQLAEKETKDLQTLLANRQVIVARWLGGLNQNGLLDDSATGTQLVTLDCGWNAEDLQQIVGYRIQANVETHQDETGWHTVYRFNATLDEQEDSSEVWLVQVYRGEKSPLQGDPAITPFNQSLKSHHHWAGQEMASIAAQLALPAKYAQMLVIAIKTHDLGKSRDRWQNAMNAPTNGRPYAKTKGGGNSKLLAGYRHEFGSLADVATDTELNQLPVELQDLALHLIASHHGYACPVIAPIDSDAPPSILDERAQQAALRFARLQRQWGPWGLAWLEAVFRAADHRASQISAEQTEKEDKS